MQPDEKALKIQSTLCMNFQELFFISAKGHGYTKKMQVALGVFHGIPLKSVV